MKTPFANNKSNDNVNLGNNHHFLFLHCVHEMQTFNPVANTATANTKLQSARYVIKVRCLHGGEHKVWHQYNTPRIGKHVLLIQLVA